MKNSRKAFTLIELLTVIAIIGILAAIIVPAVGTVQTNAKIAASKTVISNYLKAIESFKGKYKFYPFADKIIEEKFDLSMDENCTLFIETLAARDVETYAKTAAGGNRNQIEFYGFGNNEYYVDSSTGGVDATKLADRFNNRKIIIVIDADGDGKVPVPDPEDPSSTIELRTRLTAYVEADADNDHPDYYLYE